MAGVGRFAEAAELARPAARAGHGRVRVGRLPQRPPARVQSGARLDRDCEPRHPSGGLRSAAVLQERAADGAGSIGLRRCSRRAARSRWPTCRRCSMTRIRPPRRRTSRSSRGGRPRRPDTEQARAALAAGTRSTGERARRPPSTGSSRATDGRGARRWTASARRRELLEPAIAAGLVGATQGTGQRPGALAVGRDHRSQLPHALVRAYDIPPVERHAGVASSAPRAPRTGRSSTWAISTRRLATNVPGQSGQPFSPFYPNLVEGFGRGEYFPLAYSRAAVDAAAAHRLTLVPAR